MNKHERFVYRVVFTQDDVLSFGRKRYIGIDRCFTNYRAALSLYKNIIAHSDFADVRPISSVSSCGCLSTSYSDGCSISTFSLVSKKL